MPADRLPCRFQSPSGEDYECCAYCGERAAWKRPGVECPARLRAALDGARAAADVLQAVIDRHNKECGRIWYHPHAQEHRACRLPRGHSPEPGAAAGFGCEGDEP